MADSQRRSGLRILAYCVMPNHFHLIAWPDRDGQLSGFMKWLQGTHAKRWNAFRGARGTGAVYQGRFKAFPVQTDRHFYIVCRYVEQNALRAGMVVRAEDWIWSSLFERCNNSNRVALAEWPLVQPANWIDLVNELQPNKQLAALRKAVQKNAPYGAVCWQAETARALELEPSLRPRGRPQDVGSILRFS